MSTVFRFYIVLALACVVSATSIVVAYRDVSTHFDDLFQEYTSSSLLVRDPTPMLPRPEPRVVKGVYLTAYSAGSSRKVQEIISLIERTELNAVVIDIKDYSGYLLYNSQVPLALQADVVDNRLGDVRALIELLHEHDIYVIARQTVFQDPALAAYKPEWAITRQGGGLWRDYKGLSWVDPTREDVWQYNVDIAKEAIMLGFDEINFDYVRYPSDGPIRLAVYSSSREKTDNMAMFFSYLSEQLQHEPAYISLDLFGFVMERHDGMQIGQRLEDAVDTVDYISPMMYPSHYPSGHLGLSNPAAHPYAVIDHGMEAGIPYFVDTRAQVRPWIQAFHLGAEYGATNIRAQIDALEQYPNAGWLLWNAANRYTDAGLRPSSPE